MAILRTGPHWGVLFAFLVILFACPFFLSDRILTIMTMIGIAVISVHGLSILTGYCGQVSIGHVGFMAVGAYTSAILSAKLGWPFWAALPSAALAAGIAGLIFGLPSLKIKGFYLIMATIAAHYIILWLVLQLRPLTGGADGFSVPRPEIAGIVFKSKSSYYYLVMIFACLATLTAHNIVRTRAGRAFVAIRDNDLAAEVMGINLWAYKLQAFFIGCVYAGVAGALEIHYYGWASADLFQFMDSVWYLGMIIVEWAAREGPSWAPYFSNCWMNWSPLSVQCWRRFSRPWPPRQPPHWASSSADWSLPSSSSLNQGGLLTAWRLSRPISGYGLSHTKNERVKNPHH
jgi:branched-chain amino acid transport system permease protein